MVFAEHIRIPDAQLFTEYHTASIPIFYVAMEDKGTLMRSLGG